MVEYLGLFGSVRLERVTECSKQWITDALRLLHRQPATTTQCIDSEASTDTNGLTVMTVILSCETLVYFFCCVFFALISCLSFAT